MKQNKIVIIVGNYIYSVTYTVSIFYGQKGFSFNFDVGFRYVNLDCTEAHLNNLWSLYFVKCVPSQYLGDR